MIEPLLTGLLTALTLGNLVACLGGALIGTLVGVLPGLGPVATIAMLLPITYHMDVTAALIMLAGIYYGAQYGGSTTAILVNMPGESSSVVTCLDGYAMARQGRAGVALAIAAIGSFIAGCVATLLIAVASPPLVALAQSFGPAEYFALMAMGLVGAVILARGSILKAFAMVALGLLLGLIGTDVNGGRQRMTLGIPELADGIGFVAVAMGVFGIAEVLASLAAGGDRTREIHRVASLWPTRQDARAAAPAIARGTLVGALLGVLPGGGAILSSFAAYALEKRLSRTPERFGAGAIEGVAGPESANNAGAQTSFVPMLALGIPANPVMALMAGAMMLHGVQPGPQILQEQPLLFWGVIASMWIGNFALLVINLPLIGIWVRLLRVPYRILFPLIVLVCCIGVYSVGTATTDVLILLVFGAVGVFLAATGFEAGPLLLAFILGPMLEENFRRAMLLARGDLVVMATRPITTVLLVATAILLAIVLFPALRQARAKAFTE